MCARHTLGGRGSDRLQRNAVRQGRHRRLTLESLEDRQLLAGDVWTQRGSDSGHTSYLEIGVDPVSFVQAWNKPLTYTNSGTGSWSEEAVASDGVRVYRTALEGYAPTGTYHVIAYDLATGSEVWHRTFIGNAFEGVGEPSVAGGVVYVNRAGHSGISGGTSSDLPVLYGLDAATGATLVARNYEAQWGSNERPAIDGNQLVAEDGYYGGMSSFSTPSLGKQWTRPGHQLEKPFAAFDDQYVYAYGEEVFSRTTGASLPSLTHPWQYASLTDPMVSASSRVLLDVSGSEGGVTRNGVAAYDGDTHQLLWTATTPTYVGAKAVGNGIVAATAGQQLLLFRESDGALLRTWNAPSSLLGEIVLTQSHVFVQSISSGVARVHAIDLSSGQEVWTFENRNSPSGTYAMEMAMAGDKLLLSNHDFVRAFSLGTLNDAPSAANASLATNEDVQVSGNLTATDPNGDGVTFSVVGGTYGGTFTSFDPATGAFTFRPSQNFNGNGGFTFKAIDSRGAVSNVATVSIAVAPVNDAPFASSQVANTNEDTAVDGFVFASDVDNNVLTYAIVTNPTQGTLVSFNPNNGQFRYVPKPNFYGNDSFTFQANDGTVSSNVGTITIRVFAVNDAPVAELVILETPSDVAVNGRMVATDPDNPNLTYSIVTQPSSGVLSNVDLAAGTFTYTPNPGTAGIDSFTYTATDGQLTSNTATVRIQVNYVNQPPTASDQTLSTPEDTSVAGRLRATDDLGGVTFAIVSAPLRGTITSFNAQTGEFTYVPKLNHYGPDPFTFSVSDGEFTDEGTVTIDVQPVNDAPVAAAVWLYSTTEDTSLSAKLLASDVDNDPLTYAILSPPASGTLNLDTATGQFTYTPAADASGRMSLTYQASDGLLTSNIGTLYIDITPVNDAPVAADVALTTDEDQPLSGQVTATDVDNASLTYSLVSGPTRGVVTLNPDGTYTYTPQPNYSGVDSFIFRASDGSAQSNDALVNIRITPVNDAPVAAGESAFGAEDTNLVIAVLANDSDVDGDVLAPQIETAPAHGTVVVNLDGTITYDPATDYFGSDSFTYRVSDGSLASDVVTVSISLAAQTETPQISVTPDDPNANIINLASSEVAVAILSTDSFDASQVVVSSLTFGRIGTEKSLVTKRKTGPKYEWRDVNSDGRLDLVVYFKPSSTGLTTSSTEATLQGQLLDGQVFSATSPVTVTNSKGGKPQRGNSPKGSANSTAAYDAYFEEFE